MWHAERMRETQAVEGIRITSVAQVHGFIGRAPPANPHISVIAASWHEPMRLSVPIVGSRIASDLYVVSLKRGDECRMAFGRRDDDRQAGTVVFLAPGQTFTPVADSGGGDVHADEGWTLLFHPDVIAGTALADRMREHRFFGYAAEEALHIDDEAQRTLTDVVKRIEREAAVAADAFAGEVLAAQLQLLFGYCHRFYSQQFRDRSQRQGSVAARLQRHLEAWFSSTQQAQQGLPTVAGCARALGYSPDYLSDLLRAENGESARDHIHRAVIAAAKARLASTSDSISEVARALGFEHPQHFAKLFKQKTGTSPSSWRR